MKKHIDIIIKSLLAMILFNASCIASAGETNTGYFGNVAIKGYDPVAYFTEDRAVKGSENFSHTWLGADWNFSAKSTGNCLPKIRFNMRHNTVDIALMESPTALPRRILTRKPGELLKASYT
jgi:hypothetical protein